MAEDPRCPECGGYRGLARMVGVEAEDRRECTNPFHTEQPQAVEPEPEPTPAPQPTPVPEQPAPPKWKPICPYCSNEGQFETKHTAFGPYQCLAICCHACHKVISFLQPLELQLQNMVPPQMPPGMPGARN